MKQKIFEINFFSKWYRSSSPILSRMLIWQFIGSFITTLIFFIFLVLLVDFFTSIWRYFSKGIPLTEIINISLLYLPKATTYAIPVSLLFATTFTLGNLYASNQLISIFNAGISLFRFTSPIILFSLLLSIGYFFFEDRVVIPTFTARSNLVRGALADDTFNNQQITVIGDNNNIYKADYYINSTKTLTNVLIVNRSKENTFKQLLYARKGYWKEDHWELEEVRIFTFNDQEEVSEAFQPTWGENKSLITPPQLFQNIEKNMAELNIKQAKEWINTLRRTGRPFLEDLTEYYARFSFSLTSFIVVLIACSIGGRVKKNILLMSLLVVVLIAGGYYILEIFLKAMAQKGILTPILGAWVPTVIFIIIGILSMKNAKT